MRSESDQYGDESYREEDELYEDDPYATDESYGTDEYGYDEDDWEEDEDESIWRFWDEGIITLLIVGGGVLFLFPEPATSGLGVLMLGAGVLLWLVDWAT